MQRLPNILSSVEFPNIGNVSCFSCFSCFSWKKENLGETLLDKNGPYTIIVISERFVDVARRAGGGWRLRHLSDLTSLTVFPIISRCFPGSVILLLSRVREPFLCFGVVRWVCISSYVLYDVWKYWAASSRIMLTRLLWEALFKPHALMGLIWSTTECSNAVDIPPACEHTYIRLFYAQTEWVIWLARNILPGRVTKRAHRERNAVFRRKEVGAVLRYLHFLTRPIHVNEEWPQLFLLLYEHVRCEFDP